jgi:hypothetical protein
MRWHALSGGRSLSTLGKALADPLEGVQINQDVGQGVLVGDGIAIAQLGALDPEFHRLAVDAFGGSALLINFLVGFAFAVELVAQYWWRWLKRSRPILVLDRAGFDIDPADFSGFL